MKITERLPSAISWGWARLRDELQAQATRDSLIVFSGHLGQLLLGLISSAVLARSLGPEGLSVFSVVGAALAIILPVADIGLHNTAVRRIAGDLGPRPRRARETAVSYVRLKGLSSLLTAGLIVGLAGPIARALNLPQSSGRALIRIAALGLLATGLSGAMGTLLRALRRFRAMVATQLTNRALTVISMGTLFLLGRLTVAPALLVGAITAVVAGVVGFFHLTPEWQRAIVSQGSLQRSTSRRLLSFSKWLWISAVLSILSAQLDLLLLNRWSTPRIVGYYALALDLAFKTDIINQTLHTVLLPRVSALSSRTGYLTYVRRSLVRSAGLALLLVLALPFARPLILTVYGSPFAPSVTIFYLLTITVLLDLLTIPFLLLAFPLNMPRLIAASDGVRVAALLGTGVLLIPTWGMYGAVAAKLAGKVAGALVLGTAILTRLRDAAGVTDESAERPATDSAPDPPPPGAN